MLIFISILLPVMLLCLYGVFLYGVFLPLAPSTNLRCSLDDLDQDSILIVVFFAYLSSRFNKNQVGMTVAMNRGTLGLQPQPHESIRWMK